MSGTRKATGSYGLIALRTALAIVLCSSLLLIWCRDGGVTAAFSVAICGLALGVLIWDFQSGHPLCGNALLAVPALAALWGTAQCALGISADVGATEAAIYEWITRLAAAWLALRLFLPGGLTDRWRNGMLGFAVCLAVVASAQHHVLPSPVLARLAEGAGRSMGPFPNANQFAAFAVMAAPLALAGFLNAPRMNLWFAAAAGALAASVVISGSRAGSIVLALESGLVVALLARSRTRTPGFRVRAVWLVVTLFALTASAGWQRLGLRFTGESLWKDRPALALATLEMIGDRPVAGWGLGAWSAAYPAYARFDDGYEDWHAHNDWLEWAAEGGVPLTACMVAFVVLLGRIARRDVLAVGLLAVLAHCAVDYHLNERPAFAWWFFAAAGACAARRDEPQPPEYARDDLRA